MDTNGLSWEQCEKNTRAYVARNLWRLRPDMGADDIVQEMYFAYRKCQKDVTAGSIDPAGLGLQAVQTAYMSRCMRSLLFTQNRSRLRCQRATTRYLGGAPTAIRSGRKQGPYSATELDNGVSIDARVYEEVELRLAFERLSPEAQQVFLAEGTWTWSDKVNSRRTTSRSDALGSVAQALDAPSRHRGLHVRRVWAEIEYVLGLRE